MPSRKCPPLSRRRRLKSTVPQVIGSSLLFVHDHANANIWLIDFAKTVQLPDDVTKIDHCSKWVVGNHEDGYLTGVDNLISIFLTVLESEPACVLPP